MLWKRLDREPVKMIPVAMMLVVAGLMILFAGGVGPRLVHEAAGGDFARGLMVGVGIGLECVGVLIAGIAAGRTIRQKKGL